MRAAAMRRDPQERRSRGIAGTHRAPAFMNAGSATTRVPAIPRLLLLRGILVACRSSPSARSYCFWSDGLVRLSRIVRGQVLALKHADFVTAAQALGASRSTILVKAPASEADLSNRRCGNGRPSPTFIVLEAGLSYLASATATAGELGQHHSGRRRPGGGFVVDVTSFPVSSWSLR